MTVYQAIRHAHNSQLSLHPHRDYDVIGEISTSLLIFPSVMADNELFITLYYSYYA